MRVRTVSLLAVVAGLVIGLAVAGALVWSWRDDADRSHAESAESFLDAWERSRTGTFVVHSRFHRETTQGGELDSEVVLVQRPPDHLLRQFGSVEGRLDGRAVGCDPAPNGQQQCRPTGERSDVPYEETVDDEVETLRDYFFADDEHPLYRVEQIDDECFDLVLTRIVPSPPYGAEAQFCFDAATGALRFVRLVRDEGTDVTEAVEIRTEVSDADFDLSG